MLRGVIVNLSLLLSFIQGWVLIKLLDSKSDQHLISPYSNTAESFIEIMRIKEMIANQGSFDC